MKPVALALLLLCLVGCSPNTDEAYSNCFEILGLKYTLDETLSTHELAEGYAKVSEICSEAAKSDPAAFIAEWSD